ncbi:MAG: 50S ribosomal protein L21 [Patescibacteria group bacterium]
MIAVIKTGGKQYKVQAKDKLKVEKLTTEEGKEHVFDQVLLLGDKVGTPLVSGAKVKAKVLKQGRARKVEVVKYKNKTRYKKTIGHRQPYTEVEILEVK